MATISATTPIPILQFTGSGFDATRVSNPAVTYANDSYTMLYAGLPFANNVQIGLATSTNGVTWTPYAGNPVITNAGSQSWASFREMPVTLLDANGAYKTWFNGDNSNLDTDPGYGAGFGLATSPDAIDWTMSASNPIRWELNQPLGTAVNLVSVVDLNGQYDGYFISSTPSGDTLESAVSADGATFVHESPVIAPAGYTMLTATVTTVNTHPIVFSVWQKGNTEYYGISHDGLHFAIDGTINLPAYFSTSSVVVADGQIQFYGSEGVGNINWSYGNEIIDYASAAFPAIPPAVPEPSSWAMMLLGFAGLALTAYWRKSKRVTSTLQIAANP
jgi:hypothetical protein